MIFGVLNYLSVNNDFIIIRYQTVCRVPPPVVGAEAPTNTCDMGGCGEWDNDNEKCLSCFPGYFTTNLAGEEVNCTITWTVGTFPDVTDLTCHPCENSCS